MAPSDRRRTIGELGTAWLARQGHAKPSTLHAYESGWRVHVEPRWGGVPISRICHSDVQAWVSGFGRASVVRCAYGILKRILDDAVADRMLTSNPAHGVKLPAKSRREHVYLTAEQLGRLADESGTYRSLVLLLGTVGLRWGEAAALRVRDIDFLRRRIALHENAVSIGAKTYVGTLKGGESRVVTVPSFVIDEPSITAAGKGRDALLWSKTDGGYLPPPNDKSWLVDAVRRCMAADETFPRIIAHALRHTAASLAISNGANPHVVQRMLGHSSVAMTLDTYTHLFDSDMDKLAENVGKMWAQRRLTRITVRQKRP